ncbi:hypothetical protein F4775DRAFT_425232 [Biscogniauxia sp. FL1348]|nr:hypothetical protein F4775DRAFT_425232 [Biscogniauxia sp. FL1348]
MNDMEATFRSFVTCLNEKRWDDLPQYTTSPFTKNGEQYTPRATQRGPVRWVTLNSVWIQSPSIARPTSWHPPSSSNTSPRGP